MKQPSDLLFWPVGVALIVATLYFANDWTWIITCGFLGALIAIGFFTQKRITQLEETVSGEHRRCRQWNEGDEVEQITAYIKRQRRDLQESPGAIPALSVHEDQVSDLCRIVLQELRLGYVGNDTLDVGRLDAKLRHRAMSALGPISGRQTIAFMVGLLGTVLGLLIQLFIAQGEGSSVLFEDGFFNGVLMSATTTVQGIVTALYIRFQVSHLETRYEDLIVSLTDVFRRLFVPRLGGSAQSELDRFVDRFSEELDRHLQRHTDRLTEKLGEFLQQIAGQIETAVRVGVTDATSGLREAMKLIEADVKQTERALKAGTDALGIQIDRLVGQPDAASDRLLKNLALAERTARSLEDIANQVRAMTGSFDAVADQMTLPATATEGVSPQVASDLQQLVEERDRQIGLIDGVVQQLSGLVDGMVKLDDRIGRQTTGIEASTTELTRQQTQVTGFAEKLNGIDKQLDRQREAIASNNEQIQGGAEHLNRLQGELEALEGRVTPTHRPGLLGRLFSRFGSRDRT